MPSLFKRSGVYRALRHPDYASFALFGWLSTIALWLQRVCIQWLAWEMTGSYAVLGFLSLVDAAASVSSLPIGGILADRMNRLKLGRTTLFVSFLASALLALVTYEGWLTLPLLTALIVFNGVSQGLWTPVRMALVPNLVPREDLPNALALGATLFNLSQFIGPALAGVIIVTLGPAAGMALAAVLILTFCLSLYRIQSDYESVEKSGTEGADIDRAVEGKSHPVKRVFTDYGVALRYVFGNRATALILSLGAIGSFCLRSYRDLLAGYSDGLFGMGVQGLALLNSVAGISAFFGSFVISNISGTRGLSKWMVIAAVTGMLFQLMFALAPVFNLAILAVAGMSISAVSLGIMGQILMQSTVQSDLRGRVLSLWAIQLYAGPGLAAMLMGVLESLLGIRYSMLVITAILALFLLFVVRPNFRTLREFQ